MSEKNDRRQFLQASLAAGTALTLAGGNSSQGDSPSAATDRTNPSVRPGRVRWHPDFAAACTASATSGKPVLLFHMMGRLDQKLC